MLPLRFGDGATSFERSLVGPPEGSSLRSDYRRILDDQRAVGGVSRRGVFVCKIRWFLVFWAASGPRWDLRGYGQYHLAREKGAGAKRVCVRTRIFAELVQKNLEIWRRGRFQPSLRDWVVLSNPTQD